MRDALQRFAETRPPEACWAQCHAPYESMYFGTRGEVIACCYNRANPLGHYPKQSLREIWDGKAARSIRAGMLSDQSLPAGCALCESQVKAGNFGGLHAAKYDHYAGDQELGLATKVKTPTGDPQPSYPKLMEFELSNSCNLECIMCHGGFSSSIRKNREGLPPIENPYDETFVSQLEEFIPHLEDAKFLGGEPFLVGIYYEIWERMIALNPKITTHITTNGSILNPRVRRVVEKLDTYIVMSIDSIVRETYDKIRINSNFDQVQESMEYYHEVTKRTGRTLSFATCPMTVNWHEMPDLVKHCDERDIRIYFNTVVFPRDCSLQSFSSEKLDEVISHFASYDAEPKSKHQQENRAVFNDLVHQVTAWRDEARTKEASWDDPDGKEHWRRYAMGWTHVPTEEKVAGDVFVAEMRTILDAHWDAPEGIREPASAFHRETAPNDYVFVRSYLFAAHGLHRDKAGLSKEAAADLREKIDFLIANYENYSEKKAYLEKLLDASPRELLSRAVKVPLAEFKLSPLIGLR